MASASSLFDTRFFHFRHASSGYSAVRQLGASSLPAELGDQVRLVLGTHTFPATEQRTRVKRRRQERQRRRQAVLYCDPSKDVCPAWLPQTVAALYGVPFPIAPGSSAFIGAGVVEFLNETFNATDLATFSDDVAVPVSPLDSQRSIGHHNPLWNGVGEGALDIEWMQGINAGSTPWFWLVDDATKWMHTFTVDFLTATDYPTVISLSYGGAEADECSAVMNFTDCNGVDYRTYIRLVDRQFMKMGLIGVSVLIASGVSLRTQKQSHPTCLAVPH